MKRSPLRIQAISLISGIALALGLVVVTQAFGANGTEATGVTGDVATAATLDVLTSDAEDAYAKGVVEIDLSDLAAIEASEVTVEDNTVKIGAAGVFSLKGILNDGQIEIDTKGKVYLELDGMEVTSSSGPALRVKNAKKVTLILAAESTNSLSDAASGDADAAALFTNDSLVVTGAGTLTVTGNNSEGIAGDDDIVINSGTITVTAAGDGLAANDDITINGGDVTVTARGDGLDSNGTVHVNGGTLVAFGGIAQGEGGIDVRGAFVITGGTVIAGGNAMAALSSDSWQASVYVTSSAIQPAGTTVRLERDEREVFVFTPDTAYQNVLISSDDLIGGAIYQAYLDEKAGNVVVASR